MNADPRVEAMLAAAAAIGDRKERATYLDQACAGDAGLRREVESLLAAHDEAGTFLQQPAPGAPLVAPPSGGTASESPEGAAPSPLAEKEGDRIGRYKLLEKIGTGGFGDVWMADQEEPVRRRVALKVIKLGMDTREVIARFEAERQALALMDHPNIAKVFDGGATGFGESEIRNPKSEIPHGRPYFVMELVRGIRITDYCDTNNLPTVERLNLFVQVCQAVQHAHQKGIIHRDIKPSNILVTINDGVPVPKVIDFGIAKATEQRLTDKTVFTRFMQFLGTPAYMSPEQAELTSLDIDTRSDIYSLGVLLYELLTGKTPFDAKELLAAGLDEIRRVIREVEPPTPSTRLKQSQLACLRGHAKSEIRNPKSEIDQDLDWIVMKCLEKDRSRRYDTANTLATDIQRFLNHEPVLARPPSALYRWQKFAHKHRVAVAAAAGFIFVLTAATVVSAVLALWANRERAKAETAQISEAEHRQAAEKERNRAAAAEQGQIKLRQRAEANENRARTEATKSKQVATFLSEMLKGVGPSVALGRDTAMLREILDNTAKRLAKDLKNQPEVEAELRLIIGKTYKDLGQYEEALAMTREALRLRRSIFSPESPAVADALDSLGTVLYEQGNLPTAEAVGRESLAMRRKVFGAESAEVAAALNTLGNVLQTRHDLAGAEASHREALAIRKKVFGNHHLDVAGSLNNLANVVFQRGDAAGAEPLFREALTTFKRRLTDEHPIVATVSHNLAILLSRIGDTTEAEAMHRAVLSMRRKQLGNAHPDVAVSLNELAMLLAERGDLVEAEAMVQEAMENKLLRREQWRFSTTINTLAIVLSRKGDLSAAEAKYREALELRKKLLAADHPMVAESLNRLGNLLAACGDLAGADAALSEALSIRQKVQGDEHPDLIATLWPLAWVRRQQGDVAQAEFLYCEALSLTFQRGAYGVGMLLESIYDLADLMQVQGKFVEAEPLLKEAFDHLQDSSSANAPFQRGARERLIRLYEAWGKPDQAADWRQKLSESDKPPAIVPP
ncbi:MAG TPA: serine/threonine-protein kinase [Verrucomicrobiae bacterium]|nr:serine/threonine-protein kinase [Verrucomicrobiae bacterium]